jgi:hypothetical protein
LRERFEEALQLALEVERRPSPLARVIGAALAGEAYVGLGRIDDAKKALKRAETAEPKVAQALQRSPYESFASSFTQSFINTLSSEIALRGKTPEDGERQFIAMADALAVNPRLDAWADGLFRLERMARDARRAGRPELAHALIERVRKIDPEFTSTALAAAN